MYSPPVKEASSDPPVLCPSAQPEWEGSRAIGVMGGTAVEPRLAHLSIPLPVTAELLALSVPVTPAEVFRFAAPCLESGCVHFAAENRQCRLATRLVAQLPTIMDKLPTCAIRRQCRWWQQEGKAACKRCPQVVTDNYYPSAAMRQVAEPTANNEP